ncbi:hypothetical protein GP5015_1813 [gamma proteobacterium HTCC5015]|nr:hypothetical protein GP5015_1813 [gamma proteobacterium HTCC5015]
MVLLLSACRIDPDWSVSVSGVDSQSAVQAILPAMDQSAVLVTASSQRNWMLKRYSQQGLMLNEQSLQGTARATLVDSQYYDGRYYLLMDNAQGSELRVYTEQFSLAWRQSFATADLRQLVVQGTRVYLSGDRSLVLSQQGRLLTQVDHAGSVYTELQVGLFGDIYVANKSSVAAYTQEGGQLWQRVTTARKVVNSVSLQWASGELFYAQASDDGSGVTATMLSARTGDVKWQRELAALDANPHVRHFPSQFLVRGDGVVVVLQSTATLRQFTALGSNHGKPQWQVDYSSRGAEVAKLAVGLDEESLVVIGQGRTEQFSSEGKRVAWHTAVAPVAEGGQLLVVDTGIYVAQEHDGEWRLSYFAR